MTVPVVAAGQPEVIAPEDRVVEAEGPQTVIYTGRAFARDENGESLRVLSDAPPVFPVGETIVTYRATDSAGKTATAQQKITIVDTTPPQIVPPSDITRVAEGQLTEVELGTPRTRDRVSEEINVEASPAGPFAAGTHRIEWRASDEAGNTATAYQTVTILNVAPQVALTKYEPVREGEPMRWEATITDVNSDLWQTEVDYGTGETELLVVTQDEPMFELVQTYPQNGVYPLFVAVTDELGETGTVADSVHVENVAPLLSDPELTADIIATGEDLSVHYTYSDQGRLDEHTVRFDWGDGETGVQRRSREDQGKPLAATHAYTTLGRYNVRIQVTDEDGGKTMKPAGEVIVYNQALMSIAGKLEFMTPDGNYMPDLEAEGMVSVQFTVSQEAAGGSKPLGFFDLQFKNAGLRFIVEELEMLLVNDHIGYLTGRGRVNGGRGYALLLTLADRRTAQSDSEQRVRVKIWNPRTDEIIFDTQLAEPSDALPVTPLSSGGLVVWTPSTSR